MTVNPKEAATCVANGWLVSGNTYTILAVRFAQSVGTQFLIWSDIQVCVGLFPSSEFEIVDSSIPTVWSASLDLNGNLELAPLAWHKEGFWDRFHDGDLAAVAEFDMAMRELKLQRKALAARKGSGRAC